MRPLPRLATHALEDRARRGDADPLVLTQHEQVVVPGDEEVGRQFLIDRLWGEPIPSDDRSASTLTTLDSG